MELILLKGLKTQRQAKNILGSMHKWKPKAESAYWTKIKKPPNCVLLTRWCLFLIFPCFEVHLWLNVSQEDLKNYCYFVDFLLFQYFFWLDTHGVRAKKRIECNLSRSHSRKLRSVLQNVYFGKMRLDLFIKKTLLKVGDKGTRRNICTINVGVGD